MAEKPLWTEDELTQVVEDVARSVFEANAMATMTWDQLDPASKMNLKQRLLPVIQATVESMVPLYRDKHSRVLEALTELADRGIHADIMPTMHPGISDGKSFTVEFVYDYLTRADQTVRAIAARGLL